MQPQPPPTPQSGVSSCYVFKSRLQEYAQKVSLPTPVYETIKEGPSHEPTFRSTVIVNDVRYDSLLGFFNRKAAEQSAAEVALFELSKNGEVSDGISPPVHETGLCKNLLQEYAQKMNYAIPLYECQKVESRGRATFFSCTVDIGGIRYIGAAARTKKEAEIKAARTALLAIQTSDASSNVAVKTDLTVLPCKKRGPETPKTEEASVFPKPKKARFKKRLSKKKQLKFKTGLNNDKLEIAEGSNVSGTGAVDPQVLLSAPTEAVPEKIQFQIEASRLNIKSGLDDDKLKISEEPIVSGTVAVDPQVAAPGESAANGNCDEPGSQMLSSPSLNLGNYICPAEAISSIPDGCGNSFTIEVKDVAVPNLPTGNDCGSQVLMLPSLNLGNHISPVEEVSSVADGCVHSCFSEVQEEVSVVGELAPMCQMEQKIVVESMQVAPDDSV